MLCHLEKLWQNAHERPSHQERFRISKDDPNPDHKGHSNTLETRNIPTREIWLKSQFLLRRQLQNTLRLLLARKIGETHVKQKTSCESHARKHIFEQFNVIYITKNQLGKTPATVKADWDR